MKSQAYNIRVQICEKCHQHYNHSVNINSKSCHTIKNVNKSAINQQSRFNFYEEQQQYKENFEKLINELNKVQNQFQDFDVPNFNILRNKPYKYFTRAPDSKLSTKRYLNHCTNKIVQFPRRDSFEIYLQNLFLFSKLSYRQWPNLRLIARIIKILVEYCKNQGPLMQKLKDFINPQLDVKSLGQNQNKLTLYEYLVLSSDCNDPLVESYQDEDKLIQILQQIISGKIPVNIFNRIQQNNGHSKAFKREVLPYTIFDSKIKSSTMESIYLGKQNKTQRNKCFKNKIPLNNDQNNEANKNRANKTMRENTNRTYRPLSSNLSYKRKSLEPFKTTGNNKIFNMIKMGDFQQNMQQKNNQNSISLSKSLNKEISNLFSVDKKPNLKQKNDTTKKTKLFLSNNFQVVNNDVKIDQQNSIIWTNFTKTSPPEKRDSGSQISVNFNQTDGFFNIRTGLKKQTSQNDSYMKGSLKGSQKPKIVPSKKLARASLFLNQRQKNSLVEQQKIIESNSVSKSEQSKSESNKKEKSEKKKKIKDNGIVVSKKKSFSSSQSSIESKKNQFCKKLSQDQLQNQDICEMKQEYKLNVIRQSLEKRKSEQSLMSLNSQQRDSRLNELGKNKNSNELLKIDNNSLMIKSPSKLSVKSRRKSSFYYSNQKNNSLVQMIHSHQGRHERDHKQRKLRRKASQRKSRIIHKIGQAVQMGVQVNFQQVANREEKMNESEQNDLSSQSDRHCIYNTKISVPKSKDTQDDLSQVLLKKNRQIQQLNLKNNSLAPQKITRSARVSNTKRISKISLQSQLGLKSNFSNFKDQNDDLVDFFPSNRFQNAFIVQKFIQKDFYQLEIKKNFTMILNEKNDPFEFNITCQEQYRPFEIESLRDMFERCSQKKMVLFPKIFQQIQNYSTPLTEVVNRLLKFHPLSINRLFTNPHGISPLGHYCIWIYHKDINQFKPVYINDEIPFYQMQHDVNSFFMPRKLKDPVYGPVTNENSIWFILLQKALAKTLGSYYKLSQSSIADIFKMLTGCPAVNIQKFTRQKLQNIFDNKIFLNKKAYVYALRKQNSQSFRIDRVLGIKTNKESNLTLVKVEKKQNTDVSLQLQTFVRKYDQLSLVFFSLSNFFNQIKLQPLKSQRQKMSKVIGFHMINQGPDDKNDIFISLVGFKWKNIASTITIYRQRLQSLKQVQQADPLQFCQNKYIYHGEISKSGDYFFETSLQYGKYFCLIKANFEQENQYFVSTYSSKPLYMKQAIDNTIEKQISNQIKILQQQSTEFDQNMIVYDFKDDEIPKRNKYDSSKQMKLKQIQEQQIFDHDLIEDKQVIQQRKQRRISSMIKQVQKQQQTNQRNKLKMQMKTNQKDPLIKMIQKIQEKAKYIASRDNFGLQNKIKKKKAQ